MIAWPDFARDVATATPVDWPRAGSRFPVAPPPEAAVTEAPLAGREPHPPADAALEEKPAGVPPTRARRRRWPMIVALALSLAAHTAMAVWLAERMSRAGMEAETDAISVEIVLEQAEPAEAASVAGAAQASEGGDEGTPGALPPMETLTEAPPEEPTDPEPVEAREDERPLHRLRRSPSVNGGGSRSQPSRPADPPLRSGGGGPREAWWRGREPTPSPQAEPVAPSEPLPPVLTVIDPFRPELATPPVVPPPPADDIPLELVPVPMPRPERPPPVAASEGPAEQPERKLREVRQTPDRAPAKEHGAASRREQAEAQKPRGRAETGPAKAQSAGNAARSASSAGAVAGYARKVNGHLQRHKRYPEDAERRRLKGTVRLAVSIDRAGRLVGARVSGGSGHAVLDREAVATAKRAAPYPQPPDGVRADPLTLTFSLRFGR